MVNVWVNIDFVLLVKILGEIIESDFIENGGIGSFKFWFFY